MFELKKTWFFPAERIRMWPQWCPGKFFWPGHAEVSERVVVVMLQTILQTEYRRLIAVL